MHTSILRPYYVVGTQLNWDSKVGLGIEPALVHFCQQRKAILAINVVEEQRTYYMTPFVLEKFLASHEHRGSNAGKPIIYIPADLCLRERPENPQQMRMI